MEGIGNTSLLIVENANDNVTVSKLLDVFSFDKYLITRKEGERIRVVSSGGTGRGLGKATGRRVLEFYDDIFDELEPHQNIVRVVNPNYPLNSLLWKEIEAQFPYQSYDYVLSNGEECGLSGYFCERFNRRAIEHIKRQQNTITPAGYFNAMGMKKAGRHWFSLNLRRFYYEDQFEVLFDSPRSISINAIGQCNYTCLKCQYHSSDLPDSKRREYGGPMPLDKIETILDKVRVYKRLESVFPTITGEPTTHPDIVSIVRLVREAGYQCGFTTNAMKLDKKMADALVAAGVAPLAFSVDTTDPDMYQHLQEGGDLHCVEANILNFQKRFAQKNGTTKHTMNFVLSEENEHHKETYLQKWSDLGFHVQFSTYYDIFDHNRPYLNQVEWGPKERQPCWALWHGLYLTNQGRAVTCGAMAKTLGIKESIFEMDAADLWRCEALNKLRKQQLTGVKPGYCQEFTCWTGMINTYVGDENGMQMKSRGATGHIPKEKKFSKRNFYALPGKVRRVAKYLGEKIQP